MFDATVVQSLLQQHQRDSVDPVIIAVLRLFEQSHAPGRTVPQLTREYIEAVSPVNLVAACLGTLTVKLLQSPFHNHAPCEPSYKSQSALLWLRNLLRHV